MVRSHVEQIRQSCKNNLLILVQTRMLTVFHPLGDGLNLRFVEGNSGVVVGRFAFACTTIGTHQIIMAEPLVSKDIIFPELETHGIPCTYQAIQRRVSCGRLEELR